ncbi:hypothetical protein ACLB2K_058699 [Fragaria x ananassa]
MWRNQGAADGGRQSTEAMHVTRYVGRPVVHLDRLLQVSAASDDGVVVVVEGKPGDDWRRRLERHDEAIWHKPATHVVGDEEAVGKLRQLHGVVVVDTTAGVAVQERLYSVVEFIQTHWGSSHSSPTRIVLVVNSK